jgi:hypothetical protein
MTLLKSGPGATVPAQKRPGPPPSADSYAGAESADYLEAIEGQAILISPASPYRRHFQGTYR